APEGGWAFVASLAIGAAALLCVAIPSRRSALFRKTFATSAIVPAALAVLALGGSGLLPVWLRIVLLLSAGVALALAARVPRPRIGGPARVLLILVAHLDVLLAALVGAADPILMPLAGMATIAALFALGAALPPGWRFALVGVGFGYALVVLAAALGQAGFGGVALLSVTATAGLLAVAVITALPFVPARSWLATLVVAVVPFAIGVAQVVAERSGWTALPTSAMAVLAVLLMVTDREGAVPAVRLLAAGVLVPSLAVALLCLGAQLLTTSGSPVVLPLIAALVAVVLPCTRRIRGVLAERGGGPVLAAQLQHALEAGALLTGAFAVLLAVLRPAAGFGTACLVLALLAAGAGLAAITTHRQHLRAVAAAAATGALWSACAAAGVTLAEAYLLPPSLAAIALGVVRVLRGGRGGALVAAGAGGAVLPMLVLVSVGDAEGSLWRTAALIGASWGIGAAGLLLGRRLRAADPAEGAEGASVLVRRLRPVGSWLAAAAIAAGLAGTTQSILLARGRGIALLLPASLPPAPLLLACLALSAAGGLGMAMAAAGLRGVASDAVRGSRWLFAPAVVAVTAGVWPAIRRDWFSIWGMWGLMLVLLVAMVIVARRAVGAEPAAVPVWVLFALAFVTAVVAWSPRDLRVEWFSLPLGLFLLAAGIRAGSTRGATPAAARTDAGPFAALHDWPGGARGSWALLGPGIVVVLLASVVSTFTDPLTWRAILVMALALVAILVGATRRLAAPFLIGLIVLPIENVFVFAVQIGRGIESMPWWITLAVMGAVLLIIATTAERRAEHATMITRLRDLR
uniref:SCO7613 C-terminal domain-containing membrane protein n=1 Tax=uncultured Microbacterium sp. TaxID=191216 RepID=UPI0025D4025C